MGGVNPGRIATLAIVLAAALAGGAMYYLQVYGYYETLPPQQTYAVDGTDGLAITGFRGIDSTSSPLRYRACFTVTGDLPDLPARPGAEPLNAPGWFDCFDAARIGADLESGAATAVLARGNQPYGFDRVMALYPDGRAYVWPQTNACGTAVFDGRPAPAGCPPPPSR